MDLIKHAYMSDEEFLMTVLSSGDFFPGFYRFTMGDRNAEKGQLSIPGLIQASLEDLKFNRSEWMRYTKERHKTANERSSERSDQAMYELLDKSYLEWMTMAKSYDIALIEIDNGVEELTLNETYFFMGSLVRFTEDKFIIGFDLLRNETLFEIPMEWDKVKVFVESIHGKHLKDFFLKADLVASLSFDDSDVGHLNISDETITRLVLAHENSLVIASNRDKSFNLPIRWAKDILLTEVLDV